MMAEMDEGRREGVGLEDYLRILRDRGWIIAVCVVVVFVAVLVNSVRTTPVYSASAQIVYEPKDISSVVTGYQIFAYDYDKDRTIETATAVVGTSESIGEEARKQLEAAGLSGAELSLEELLGMVSASVTKGTNFVSVTATSTVRDETAAVANAFAEQFIIYRRDERRGLVAEARDVLKSQLDAMTAEELDSPSGLLKQSKYEELRVAVTVTDSDFKLLQKAEIPDAPFTPQTKRDVVLAVVLGLVAGVGLAFLLEYLDKRIKDERTLERVSGLPVLASVPVVGRTWRNRRSRMRTGEAVGFAGESTSLLEAFRTLRSSLQYFNVDGTLRKILVTSGLPLEGKTVTAVNLAISLAMSGKRVIVLEADLRRPMVHQYLELPNEVGLSNVLAGTASVPEALRLVAMDPLLPARARKGENGSSPSVLRKNLYCMTSGPLPPNPAELLQSARMDDVLEELERLADYVVVDTPPVLPLSDAVALAPNVDAVIIAARMHSTTRDEIGKVTELLQRAGAHVVGVVAGGVRVRASHYYKRGYYYRYGGYGY